MGKNKFFDNKAITIHGILAILFGVIVLLYPALTVSMLATFFGLLLLVGGIILSLGAYMGYMLSSILHDLGLKHMSYLKQLLTT